MAEAEGWSTVETDPDSMDYVSFNFFVITGSERHGQLTGLLRFAIILCVTMHRTIPLE